MRELNGKFAVHNIVERVDDWLSEYLLEKEFDRKLDHYCEVRKKEGIIASTWSDTSIDNLYSRSKYAEACVLVHVDHWGDEEIRVDIKGNRWIDLWKAAEKAIILSGDLHHCYIEEFLGTEKSMEITFSAGS